MNQNKLLLLICLTLLCGGCTSAVKPVAHVDIAIEEKQVISMLDSFNLAAAKADFDQYFDFYAADAIFTGTDATERWNKKQFMVWAKPYFDKGKAWSFIALQRNIYFDKTANFAWFDELLNTSMKICRGSGVLIKDGGSWRIQQYILSTTIPNDKLDSIIGIKSSIEDSLIQTLLKPG